MHQYSSNAVLHGDTGWLTAEYRRYLAKLRLWNRLTGMPNDRVTKNIFNWDYVKDDNSCFKLFIITKSCQGLFLASFLKSKMVATGIFRLSARRFVGPSRAKGIIIGRDLKFAGYVHHYKILTGNISGLILKNKMAATGVSFQS